MHTITAKGDGLTRLDFSDVEAGWKQEILFLSDIHIDSPHCDRKLLKQHLDMAVERNAVIMIAGDLFDAMQGRDDPRRSYSDLKKILAVPNYFDGVLKEGLDFFRPYAAHLAMCGYGNHEYSVLNHNGTDLIQRFVGAMRDAGSPVVVGGYGGFIRLSVFISSQPTPKSTMWIYYNHGSGGEAPVTKGMIQTNRQAVWVRNCDLIWNGHNHQNYVTFQSTVEPNNKDVIEQGLMAFIRTPGYKNERKNIAHGYAAQGNMSPTPRGCVFGSIKYSNKKLAGLYTADVE